MSGDRLVDDLVMANPHAADQILRAKRVGERVSAFKQHGMSRKAYDLVPAIGGNAAILRSKAETRCQG